MKIYKAPSGTLKIRSCADCPDKKGFPIKTATGYVSGWGCSKQPTEMLYRPDGSLGRPRMAEVSDCVSAGTIHQGCPLPEAE